MHMSAPIFYLKRQAKRLAQSQNIPLSAAQAQVAASEGFQSWSHMARAAADASPAKRLLRAIAPGGLALVAARPGQGKTLLALEVLAEAGGGHVFTLDYTEAETRDRFSEVGGTDGLVIDTSDEISADHIIQRMQGCAEGTIAVIDYLQLLDQRRSTPPLDAQVAALAAFAQRSGARILCISQIDRRFDTEKGLPDAKDIRMPNPVDLNLFTTTCFLHDGRVRIS
jgi:replicative DNA helicase